MFQVKICGITDPADAQAAADAQADAIGLNFFPLSPRFVDDPAAEKIAQVRPSGVALVGVFVNSPAAEVQSLAARLRLDYVQIHGDEPPEFLRELEGLATIRALRCGADLEVALDYLAQCRRLGCLPAAVLVDALQPGHFGGTGAPADWPALAAARSRFEGLPLILAGGLTAANVSEAIQTVGPAGVDVASGVETAPGRKSSPQMRAFVAAARVALGQRTGRA